MGHGEKSAEEPGGSFPSDVPKTPVVITSATIVK